MNELQAFEKHLRENEKSPATIEKYLRDTRAFLSWLDGREPTKELTVCYKEGLTERYEVASINSMLAGINSYLSFSGRADCRVKPLRVQRTLFGSEERERNTPALSAPRAGHRLALSCRPSAARASASPSCGTSPPRRCGRAAPPSATRGKPE